MHRKAGTNFFLIFTLIGMIYTLIFPFEVTYHVKKAVELCISAVFPSLFMFIVTAGMFSGILQKLYPRTLFIQKLSQIFCVDEILVPVSLMGLFCGAPSASIAICEIYKNGCCTKQGAENAIILSNNCSTAFILGIGASVTGLKTAFIIALANIITTITVYLLLFKKKLHIVSEKKGVKKDTRIVEILTDSISSGFKNTLSLCGYVIFFYSLSFILCNRAETILSKTINSQVATNTVKAFIHGFLELTSGVLSASSASENGKIMLTSLFCAFCSLSVMLQVSAVCSKASLSSKNFIASKFFCALVSPIITLIFIFILPREVTVMNSFIQNGSGGFSTGDLLSLAIITCIFFMGVEIASYIDKKHKNK